MLWGIYWHYAAPLFVITLLSLTGTRQMIRTALALLCNWIAGTVFVLATGVYDPWYWFLLIDATAAAVVLYQPAGKMQAVIGFTYIAQIIMHAVYAVSNSAIAAYGYWQALTAIAFLQLILMGGWIGGRWYRRYYGHRRDLDGAVLDGT